MQIESTIQNDITIITVAGDIDSRSASTVQDQIIPMTIDVKKLILDLSKVDYMSSAGLRVLLLLYRQVASQKGQIILVGLSPSILDTMSVTGFLKFFMVMDEIEAAMTALQS